MLKQSNHPIHSLTTRNPLRLFAVLAGMLLMLVGITNCATPPEASIDSNDLLTEVLEKAHVEALDLGETPPAAKVALGEALFFDPEVSGNRDTSCATCHHPTLMMGDNLPLPVGTGGVGLGTTRIRGYDREMVPRNAPEIFNRGSAEWHTMFWDARVSGTPEDGFISPAGDDLPDGLDNVLAVQAMFPPTSAAEMRGDAGDMDINGVENELANIDGDDSPAIWAAIMDRLLAIPEYRDMFKAAYPEITLDELGFEHAANAIAAYEIVTFSAVDGPFDQFLAGDTSALSEKEKEGALLFYGKAGCAACHSGSLMTDQAFHNIAVPQLGPGKADDGLDPGRYLETENDADLFAFRTPPLRNVALTGPWMHNGAYVTLEGAVKHHLAPASSLTSYSAEQLTDEFEEVVRDEGSVVRAVLANLDPMIQNQAKLSDKEFGQLMAFLHCLTSPSAMHMVPLVPDSVPSGLLVEG